MSKHLRRPLGWLALTVLSVLLLAATDAVLRTPASAASILPPGALAPTDDQRAVARKIGRILEETHYSRAAIDDTFSREVFKRYLEFLDPEHSYFLASDVQQLSAYRDQFDDMIHTGNVDPGYVIFDRFKQRNRERMQYALELLKSEPDWNTTASYDFDREHAPWPATGAEMDQLWKKRVINDAVSLMLAGKTWPQAANLLRKRYQTVITRVDQIKSEDVFEDLMNAYARTYDPHTSYFSPLNSEEYRIQMSLNYEGIGASLQLIDNYVTIMNVIQGGPAATAGTLKPNDRITAVGQGDSGPVTDVVGWRLDDVVQLIRGKAGTEVRLQVLPAGAAPGSKEKTLQFVRNKVTLKNQEAQSKLKTVTDHGRTYRIGVITVPSFYEDIAAENAGDPNYRSTTRDVLRLLEKLEDQHIDGLVLDLRDNGGGYLPEATALTGLFTPHGPVVRLRDRSGHIETLQDPEEGPAYTGPLAVLVNRFSASASEIFAGAIQDYHRGVIIGQNTFGKGTVQNLVPLDRWSEKPVEGQLTVTIGKFYRITGESTQHRGVVPDVTLPSPIDPKEVGEADQPASLPWDRISGVPFTVSTGMSAVPSITQLSAAQTARAQRDPNYQWLAADINSIDGMREQHTVSLNLTARREERTRNDKALLSLDNKRRAALGLPPLKAVEQIDKDNDKIPDVILDQAADITADMVALDRSSLPVEKTASTNPERGS
ncbi:MAG TPA: carboxy terminal-processing peptidase [Steroidobacteraceae bacterium]|jgi:carboxyl-terminal processing protease|nr:carboxy terminal-processing peptidase [Steroidobacteraceae bacterium]